MSIYKSNYVCLFVLDLLYYVTLISFGDFFDKIETYTYNFTSYDFSIHIILTHINIFLKIFQTKIRKFSNVFHKGHIRGRV